MNEIEIEIDEHNVKRTFLDSTFCRGIFRLITMIVNVTVLVG